MAAAGVLRLTRQRNIQSRARHIRLRIGARMK
jgi:hypothetical protein